MLEKLMCLHWKDARKELNKKYLDMGCYDRCNGYRMVCPSYCSDKTIKKYLDDVKRAKEMLEV